MVVPKTPNTFGIVCCFFFASMVSLHNPGDRTPLSFEYVSVLIIGGTFLYFGGVLLQRLHNYWEDLAKERSTL